MITFLVSLITLISSSLWLAWSHSDWLRSLGENLIRLADASEKAREAFEQPAAKRKPITPEVITDPLKEDVVSALVNQGMRRKQAEVATSAAISKSERKDFDAVFVVALQIARAA